MVWIGNCDVTNIDIWSHYIYTIWRSKLAYTILDKITPLSKRIGEPPEIQIGCYRGDPGHQRHSGSSNDLFWLTEQNPSTLRHWNFLLLSFWLALSLLYDVKLCNNQWEILIITYPLLSSLRHRAMITPVSPLLTRLIHNSPRWWTIYRSFEIILEMGTVHWIELQIQCSVLVNYCKNI